MPPLPPAANQKCRVWTASYGGQKALIIRSVVDQVVNYTVLDVNEGSETREAEAFIAAYAKDGKIAGEYNSQAHGARQGLRALPGGLIQAGQRPCRIVPLALRCRLACPRGSCWRRNCCRRTSLLPPFPAMALPTGRAARE